MLVRTNFLALHFYAQHASRIYSVIALAQYTYL